MIDFSMYILKNEADVLQESDKIKKFPELSDIDQQFLNLEKQWEEISKQSEYIEKITREKEMTASSVRSKIVDVIRATKNRDLNETPPKVIEMPPVKTKKRKNDKATKKKSSVSKKI